MATVVDRRRCGCCKVLFNLAAECIIIILTILHVLMSAIELLIHLEVVQAPNDPSTLATTTTTVAPDNATTSKPTPYDPGGYGCHVSPTHPDLLMTVDVVNYATLALSGVFLVEILFKIGYLQREFFKDICQVFDMLVVVCSLGVEVSYLELHGRIVCVHPALEVASFIIVLRLWRIPRACNVRRQTYKAKMEDEIRYLRKTKQGADDQCQHLRELTQKQEKQLDRLRKQLHLLDGGVYTGDDKTDGADGHHYQNGGLRGVVASVLSADETQREEIAQDGGENDHVTTDKSTVAFTSDTSENSSQKDLGNRSGYKDSSSHNGICEKDSHNHNDLYRKDSDVNSKANDSGIDAKDSFRSDIDTVAVTVNGYVRGYKHGGDDEVFAGDSDGSETPVYRTVQQVEVQIEEPSRQKQLPSVRSVDGNSEENVVMRRRPSDHFVPYFENAAYDADGDEEEDLNKSRTYRSADGVPMTEL